MSTFNQLESVLFNIMSLLNTIEFHSQFCPDFSRAEKRILLIMKHLKITKYIWHEADNKQHDLLKIITVLTFTTYLYN